MIKRKFALDTESATPWPTLEPFLFCVHHLDRYPRGESNLGVSRESLRGRNIGQDFIAKDGFRMYHGDSVPGFPVHPHRGFETVTIVRRGYVDHADSLGAAGRYGEGDVQWMTAGGGIQHSEMFPLLRQDSDNTAELFQIWLNLPKKSKMVPAHFKMFWSERIPTLAETKSGARLIAGTLAGTTSLAPPPDSWAASADNDVLILEIKIEEGGRFQIPKTTSNGKTAHSNTGNGPAVKANRMLYYFSGAGLQINGQKVESNCAFEIESDLDLELASSSGAQQVLVLQARPIGEPVVQHGPFVMNSKQEIYQTIEEYQRTEFGGWPWPRHDMIHGAEIRRFAKFPDGHTETP